MGWWSECIMGGDTPLDWQGTLCHAMGVKYGDNGYEYTRELIEAFLPKLVSEIEGSRYDKEIGFQVLGVMILATGAAIDEPLRKKIIKAAKDDEWAKESEVRRNSVNELISAMKKHKPGEIKKLEQKGLIESIAEKVMGKGQIVVSKTAGTTKELGSFEISGTKLKRGKVADGIGKIIISDPCYSLGTWCNGEINARTGTWHAKVITYDEGQHGDRIAELIAWHSDIDPHEIELQDLWQLQAIDVGVDSGQAGFFDKNHFRKDKDAKGYKHKSDPICEDEPWYSMCCDCTLTAPGAAVIPGGVVSRSGWGDGSYECYAAVDNSKKAVALKIVFISYDDDEEEDACEA